MHNFLEMTVPITYGVFEPLNYACPTLPNLHELYHEKSTVMHIEIMNHCADLSMLTWQNFMLLVLANLFLIGNVRQKYFISIGNQKSPFY